MVKKRIAFCTGTRAEYGLLKPLMDLVLSDSEFEFELYVTGMHLSPEFGTTVTVIHDDGIPVSECIEILLSGDTPTAIMKSMGLAMIGFGDVFKRRQPDLLVILGDRFETFCAAAAATVACIPLAHLHGGESTEGAIDDAFRHSISKMSILHFASTEAYRRRIIQMGEDPSRVFNVGSLGVEAIRNTKFLSRPELERALGSAIRGTLALVTFHPATLDREPPVAQMHNLLMALDASPDLFIIFTRANADANGRAINELIDKYIQENPARAIAFASLGQLRYLSAMRLSAVVIGNSSSGIIEAPSLHVPTVNIGDRQRGRIRAKSVIDCGTDMASIVAAISHALSDGFSNSLGELVNPYEGQDVARTILERIRESLRKPEQKKSFYEGPIQ